MDSDVQTYVASHNHDEGYAGRKEQQPRPGRLNQLSHPHALVAAEVVHHDDGAGPQLGNKDLRDVRLERLAVDGTVDHERCDQSRQGKAGHERRRLPMGVRGSHPEALAPAAPPVSAHHVLLCPSLVNENELRGIEVGLARDGWRTFDQCSISANATAVEVFRTTSEKRRVASGLQAIHQIGAVMRSGEY